MTYSFAVVADYNSSGNGQYDLIDANGNIIATVSQTGTVTYVTPQGPGLSPAVSIETMTAAQFAFEQAIIEQLFQTLNLINNPNSQPGAPGSSTPPNELNNFPQLLQENGGNPFAINIPVPGGGSTTVPGTVTVTTVTPAPTPTATVTWISSTGGSWGSASNWSDGLVPVGWENVDILLPLKVTIGDAEEAASLVLGAGAILNIISGGTLTIANGISNSGVVQLNSSGADPTLAVNGTVYRLDGGAIKMLGANDQIIGVAGSGATLVNVDNTIVGSGAIGHGDGNLTLVNGSAGLIEAKPLLATDSGILVIDTGNTVSNSGRLEAVAGGTLQIDDPVNNRGTILADGGTVNINNTINNAGGTIEAIGANSLVQLSDATVEGGTLFTSGPGSSGSNINVVVASGANMSVLDGTSEGPLTVEGYVGVFQGAQLELQGTIHIDGANGEIDVGGPSNAAATTTTNLVIDGTVTIDTDGLNTTSAQISLDGSASNTVQIIAAPGGGTLDNVNTLIAGGGNIGAGDPSFLLINEASGVINASGTTALVIDNDSPATDNFAINEIVNSGTIEATGSGGLTIENTTIDNSTFHPSDNSGVDGHIEVFAGSQINLDNATILQGFVSTAAGGEIATVSGSSNEIETANGSTHNTNVATIINAGTLAVSDGSSLTLAAPDAIDNSGTIQLNSNGDATYLYFDQPAAGINGGGQIALSDSTENFIAVATSGDQLDNFDNTISGAGTIGMGGMVLVNGGTIDADYADASLTLDPTSLTNTGTLEATNGGTLLIDPTTVTNTEGTIAAYGDGSVVQLSDVTITGGTLTTDSLTSDSGGVIEVLQVTGASDPNLSILDGSTEAVMVDGYVRVDSGANLELVGTIHNEGTIDVDTEVPSTTDLIIDGRVTLDGGGMVTLDGSSDQIIGASGDGILDNVNNTVSGAGQIGTGDDLLTLINAGTVDANISGETLTLDTGGNTITNTGTLEATNGGTLLIDDCVCNTGTLAASGGIVDAVAAVNGSGEATIGDAGLLQSTLEFQSYVSACQTVTFTDAIGTLALADPTDFHANIAGLVDGDTIDLTNIAPNAIQSATIEGSTLVVDETNDTTLTFNIAGSLTGSQFNIVSDNSGGTNLVLEQTQQNLVVNGGFETGNLSGWTTNGASDYTYIDTEHPHSGNYDLAIGPVDGDFDLDQNISTVQGATYQVEFWLSNGGPHRIISPPALAAPRC